MLGSLFFVLCVYLCLGRVAEWFRFSELKLNSTNLGLHPDINLKWKSWVLVKVPRPQTHRTSQWWIKGCQVMIRKAWLWIIVGNQIREYHGSCTLKTSFVDFCPYPTLYTFVVAVKSHWPRWPIPPFISIEFLYIIELVLILNITEILLSECWAIINQSLSFQTPTYGCGFHGSVRYCGSNNIHVA